MKKEKNGKARILIFDIETAPLTAYVWGARKQYVGLNQIKSDWHFLAWAAKWLGDPPSKVMYMDNSKAKDITDDRALIEGLWKLLDEADIVIGHNSNSFDIKKFNARAILHGLPPVSHFRTTDTYREARKAFGFTSHKLEYLSNKLNKKYKKLPHNRYPGLELWKAVISGDKRAWKDMKAYNVHDVLATEELYTTLQGWIKTQDLAMYVHDEVVRCHCGSRNIKKDGRVYLTSGVYQGYKCNDCGKRPHGKTNLMAITKRRNLLR